MQDLNRRDFVKTTATLLGAASIPALPSFASANPTAGAKELRILQIGVGGIGKMDRNAMNSHPRAKIVGLCDIDKGTLYKLAKNEFPDAIAETDYRKFFSDHLDQFDAVNVCTPDHHHGPMMMAALAHNKHLYAQKPVVQQLEEIAMLDDAVKARPHLATQTGNQRMGNAGRRIAVEILKRDLLGAAVEGWLWTSSDRGSAVAKPIPGPSEPHPNVDWNLWLGPAPEAPYRKGIAPRQWRAWFEYGTGSMGDWGVHLFDVIMYSYPELTSPIAVQTNALRAADWQHVNASQATLTYAVDSQRFKRGYFPIHYLDGGQKPSLHALGVFRDKPLARDCTLVVCEAGTLILSANGALEVWQGGKRIDYRALGDFEGIPKTVHHWHTWIDQALGDKDAEVWTPLEQGLRMTEASILPGKASRFPGTELFWDKTSLTFTNSQEATDTVVRRAYRDGFAPPKVS